MMTFDLILNRVISALLPFKDTLELCKKVVVNRDLNGRVRLVVTPDAKTVFLEEDLQKLAVSLSSKLGKHGFPTAQMILIEEDMDAVVAGASSFPLEGVAGLRLVDRLATESRWAEIAPISSGAPRIVFFSIKGGVGRSTAMAAAAWALAQAGKRVLVMDLDLESPGLSSALLPIDRRPAFGITDWLVEDLVDNSEAILGEIVGTSALSHDGEIFVVPAHGKDAGEYVSKLGRVWMPKTSQSGREDWSQRLGRLINSLEETIKPDVILIDSRSGIDDISSSCVTDLGASLVLLFAVNGEQTWSGYKLLFEYWNRADSAQKIRERLQIVGAMVPEIDAKNYISKVRENSWDLFSLNLYDEIPPGELSDDYWNFDDSDESSPHYPWAIRWHRGFAALSSLHERLDGVDPIEVEAVFGEVIKGIHHFITQERPDA